MTYKAQERCRICGHSDLEVVFDLGEIYPSAFLDADQAPPEKLPLTLVQCCECGLVQLAHDFDLDDFYRQYYYQSGINPSMVAALQNVVDSASSLVTLEDYDVVVDIGANDLSLLGLYPDTLTRIAFEPARNIPRLCDVDYFINDYFSLDNYPTIDRAKIVTSIAMFYDLPDPPRFVGDVMSVLDDDGVWVMQISDLLSMLQYNMADEICHEHYEYYSARNIVELVSPFGLEVFRIEKNAVNGGSLRFYIDFKGVRSVEQSVADILKEEDRFLRSADGSFHAFSMRVSRARATIVDWLTTMRLNGESVYGIAASTKGNTILQAFGIDNRLLPAIGDLNPDKFGKFTVGTSVPIIAEADVMAAEPDYLLVLAWGFMPFFLEKFAPYLRGGGALVTPLPEPRIYRMDTFGEIYSETLEKELASGD